MMEKPDTKTGVTLELVLLHNVFTQEALINLLEKKGIITKAELLEEITKIKARQIKAKC